MNTETTATQKTRYWYDSGKYQASYDKFWTELVPNEGDAPTIEGRILLAASKLYHDLFNNGFDNLGTSERLEEALALLTTYRRVLEIEVPMELINDYRDQIDEDSSVEIDQEDCEGFADALEYIMDQVLQYIESKQGYLTLEQKQHLASLPSTASDPSLIKSELFEFKRK